jgi:Ca-activated chloride channel family protein
MSEALTRLLAALGADALERPAWLPWLAAVALVAWFCALRRRPPALAWAALPEARAAAAGHRELLPGLARGLRVAALLALAVVLAGPVGVHRVPPVPGRGLDLVLVLDASGSMRALDADVEGEPRTRLELAREVVARFAEQRAAEGDRVALVVFGEAAFTLCPLTSDGRLLAAALARVEAGIAGEATALGEALALGLKRVNAGQAARAPQRPGRVAVLLTDGRHNAGAVSVEAATALAAEDGVRVHTVAIGSAGEEVAMQRAAGAAGRALRFERHDVDAASLARVAAATGGRFFAARRSSDLVPVYAEIDRLERPARRLPPRTRTSPHPEPWLVLAGGCLAGELLLARVLWRRLP